VLEDPFGFSAVFGGEKYGAPNRYFAHWFMGFYFKNIPALLQHFVSPIDSIYLACALLKTGVQVLIGWLLAAFISGSGNPLRRDFLLAAVLVFPLFQNADYRGTMGIIDGAITYVCFFALPLGLLLLFFLPFFKALRTGRDLNMNFFKITIWAALAVVLAFNGPVVPPVVLIGSFLLLVYWSRKVDVEKEGVSRFQRLSAVFSLLPKQSIALLVFFSLLCLYSLYLGTFNLESQAVTMPVVERYARLPLGIFNQFSLRLGLPLLLGLILLHVVILKKQKREERATRILAILKWLAVFSVLFILLLPLGGYRDYRPNLIRRDAIMPVILCMMYGFGLTSWFLLKKLSHTTGKVYAIWIGLVLMVYVSANVNPELLLHNQCQRAALEKIASSPEKVVRLDSDCTVMTWHKITDDRDSELYGRLLLRWGVTKEMKYFYQE
jgi:hypothetical protein